MYMTFCGNYTLCERDLTDRSLFIVTAPEPFTSPLIRIGAETPSVLASVRETST